ncbi:endonuclease [Alkalimarinus alittae]|uniref:Endonuclease n=1 Tax=Alkalimarinus alittae TaxID=2961619 RepID=A0ABY6N5B0_9ALTE|nr:endonuclease [Alkalimarinus alittae]UZE97225.1 endonuclease [Alkalimarinus alittae]
MNTKKHLISLIALLITTFALVAHADTLNFRKAKKELQKVYSDNQISFYCGCTFSSQLKAGSKTKKRLTPDWDSCGYTPRKQPNRASRIEWEHVMPAHHFGQHMQCWRDGGRKVCKKDNVFKEMEGDMHNLVPAIGEVNGDRSNFKYGMIENESRVYGSCDAEVDFKGKRFEPSPSVRGDIARTYFYMSERYNVRLSKQQRQLLSAWDKLDPVDDWERTKNKRIESIQGNSNPFIQ